ncbi:hypothetical protein RJ640_029198 [Escallonia rubra]|uniref:Uncharacterized protein n=1 Tax=Escallonia rubra TaxID=112253 RepID=A0AA88R8G5_9ASTE|nr:hypothetical protein RJ640_029198 [Escallonia rubra]
MTWSHRTLHRRGSASNGTNSDGPSTAIVSMPSPSQLLAPLPTAATIARHRFRHYSVRTATVATINVEPSYAIEIPKKKWSDLPLFTPNRSVQIRHNRHLHRTTASQCPADHGPIVTNYDHDKSMPLPPSDRPPSLRLTFRRRQTHASAIGVPPKPGPWRPIKKRAFSSIDKPRMKRLDLPLTGGVDVFASVFADSFVRVFDLPAKEHPTIIYVRSSASAGTSRTLDTRPPSSWTAPRLSSSTSASSHSLLLNSSGTRPASMPSPGHPTALATSALPAMTPRLSFGTSPPMGQPIEGGLDPILAYTAGAEIEQL